MAYCTASDIEAIFGLGHVTSWATMDPEDSATTIAARKTLACNVASSWLDDILRATSFEVPAVDSSGATPTTISDLSARLAGLWLYEANGADAANRDGAAHRYSFMREDVYKRLEAIRTGLVKIDAVIGG